MYKAMKKVLNPSPMANLRIVNERKLKANGVAKPVTMMTMLETIKDQNRPN